MAGPNAASRANKENNHVQSDLSRRAVLGGLGLTAGAGVSLKPAQAKDFVMGFIYVGPKDDYGYNQAHAEAAAILKKTPGVKIVEEERSPKPTTYQKRWRA